MKEIAPTPRFSFQLYQFKNPWSAIAVEKAKQEIAHYKRMAPDKADHLELLSQFSSLLFAKELPPYNLSSWLAHTMLYDYYGVDVVIYPSFTLETKMSNMAFHPNFVEQYFRLEKVTRYEIKAVSDSDINYTIKKIGRVNLTNIEWKNPTEEDEANFMKGANKKIIDSAL